MSTLKEIADEFRTASEQIGHDAKGVFHVGKSNYQKVLRDLQIEITSAHKDYLRSSSPYGVVAAIIFETWKSREKDKDIVVELDLSPSDIEAALPEFDLSLSEIETVGRSSKNNPLSQLFLCIFVVIGIIAVFIYWQF